MTITRPLAARPQGFVGTSAISGGVLALGVLLAVILPKLVDTSSRLAISTAALLLAVGLAFRWPWILPVAAFPAILLSTQRIGGSAGSGLAAGDLVLIAAAGIAIPALRQQARTIARPVMLSFAFYLLLLVPSLITVHNRVALVEVIHRMSVVIGGLSVGLLVQRMGRLDLALKLLYVGAGVVGIASIVYTVSHGFAPAYPLGLQKNFAGLAMARCAAVLIIAPHVVTLEPRTRHALLGVLLLGLASTQSRNAIIALTVAAVIWVVKTGALRTGRGAGALALVFALGGFAGFSLVTEAQNSQAPDSHTSITQRNEVEQATRDLWRTSPYVGVGLRFFNTSQFNGYQAPNNVFDEILAEAGVFGAAGMVIFIVGSCAALSRGKGDLAVAGLTLVATGFLSAQFDIFWANGQALPWMIAGAGAASDKSRQPTAREIRVAA